MSFSFEKIVDLHYICYTYHFTYRYHSFSSYYYHIAATVHGVGNIIILTTYINLHQYFLSFLLS